jgi:hypothetical protein
MGLMNNFAAGVGLLLTVEIIGVVANVGWSYLDNGQTFEERLIGETGLTGGV